MYHEGRNGNIFVCNRVHSNVMNIIENNQLIFSEFNGDIVFLVFEGVSVCKYIKYI